MKIGYRKRSINRSLSSMTSGRYKRMAKRVINPFYGRKGIGYLKNPSKAMRGAVYRRLTVGTSPSDLQRASRPPAWLKEARKNERSFQNQKVRYKRTKQYTIAKEKRTVAHNTRQKMKYDNGIAKKRMQSKYHLSSANSTRKKEKINNTNGKKVFLYVFAGMLLALFIVIQFSPHEGSEDGFCYRRNLRC